jgi:hypothetical protein
MKDLAQIKEKKHFKHHFVPHKEKKVRASLLNHKAFHLYSLLFILFLGLVNLSKSVAPGILGYSSEITVRQLLENTNQIRESSNKKPLILSEKLSKAAEEKAKYMFEKNFWAHTSPDGVEPWVFILDQGYDYSYAGENLARNFYYSNEVVDAWMKSPTHKENLLSSNYDEVGFAVVNGVLDGYETTLVVQMFGRPKDFKNLVSIDEQDKFLASIKDKIVASEVSNNSLGSSTFTVDLPTLFRYISFSILGFVLALLFIDIFYSKKHGIEKFTGHTSAHIIMIFVSILSLYVIYRNGHIL